MRTHFIIPLVLMSLVSFPVGLSEGMNDQPSFGHLLVNHPPMISSLFESILGFENNWDERDV